jgi:hypothetical protein
MPDNLFTEENKSTTNSNGDPVLETKIEELKTKSVDELAKGKAHADQFIDFLKEQNNQLKEELDKRLTAEKALEELKAARNTEVAEEHTSSGLKPEDMEARIVETVQKLEERKSVEANIVAVEKAVKDKYGEKSKEFIHGKAAELGMSPADLGNIAAKSPIAFFNLVGLEKPASSGIRSSEGTINTEAFSQTTNLTAGTKAYYDKIRKENPAQFYDPKVQQQMFKDRKRLGQDFYK